MGRQTEDRSADDASCRAIEQFVLGATPVVGGALAALAVGEEQFVGAIGYLRWCGKHLGRRLARTRRARRPPGGSEERPVAHGALTCRRSRRRRSPRLPQSRTLLLSPHAPRALRPAAARAGAPGRRRVRAA